VNVSTDHIIISPKELLDVACTSFSSSFSSAAVIMIPAYHEHLTLVPLQYLHIQFGQRYKQQENLNRYLSRFKWGSGVLYNNKFLMDACGQFISAFGYHAGYTGTSIILLT
jgi:hypothetical protein